jgi:membrane peptidoglycan carboxypeptidase
VPREQSAGRRIATARRPTRARRAGRDFLRVVLIGAVIMAACIAVALPGFGILSRSVTLSPALGPLRTLSQPSAVYAADGKTQLGVLGLQNRELASFSEVPKTLVDAVVATEDETFWTNPGVDPTALARALVRDVSSGGVVEGGSTITQQLVKNRMLSPKRDLKRKLEEVSLAIQMSKKYSKKTILQEYLNTVYFGEGAYGVKSAASRYFLTMDRGAGLPRAKTLGELSLADSALLAGLIANPSANDPFAHPDAARARRAEVLTRMVQQHYVTQTQADEANAQPMPTVGLSPSLGPHDYIVDQVQQELLADSRLGATAEERRNALLNGGLHVYTTIDPGAQADAQAAVDAGLPDQPPFTAALVAIDPATGGVRAMVGGPGFEQLQYDIATQTPGRQAGSTYKVITLAAALEAGYSPNDTLDGSSPCVAVRPPLPPWPTVNAEPGNGDLSLRDATADSVNCAFAHLIASLGPEAVVDMAHRLGITQPVPPYLSITLGTKEATPLEMATVASTLAAGGIHHNPRFIDKVTDRDGNVVFDDSQAAGQRVVAQDVVDCETDVLRGVVQHGTGVAAAIDGYDVAGKTGTTDSKTDAWFLGYAHQLAAVVWMGAPQAQLPMDNVGGITVYGGTYPARIWHAFMSARLAGQPNVDMPPPGPVCDRPGASVTDTGRGQPLPPDLGNDAPVPAPAPAPPPAPRPAPAPNGKH